MPDPTEMDSGDISVDTPSRSEPKLSARGVASPLQPGTPPLPKFNLGPFKVVDASMTLALTRAESLVGQGGHHYFCFCEASLFSSALRSPRIRIALASADAVFADGVGLLHLAHIRGRRLAGRVTGPGFLLAAAGYGVERNWRHFLYGGGQGVAEGLAERLRRDFPGIIIAGAHSPPFRKLTEAEEAEEKKMIESANPHLLWVCLGSPKQELWCAEHLGKINVPLMLPVGAAFDFHSNSRPWAPQWIRNIGMEWAFRTFTGGRRTFFRNARCVTVMGLSLARTALIRMFKGLNAFEQKECCEESKGL